MKDQKKTGFIKLPRALLTDRAYHGLSIEAKVLYALMLDRLSLSEMNEWEDKKGEVYIYCTLEEGSGSLAADMTRRGQICVTQQLWDLEGQERKSTASTAICWRCCLTTRSR